MNGNVQDILDISKPIAFPPVLGLSMEKMAERRPAPEVMNGPWFQYAEHVMSAFHAEGVTDTLTSFFARALSEAHEMGIRGMEPLPAGQPRAGSTRGARPALHHAPKTVAATEAPPTRVIRRADNKPLPVLQDSPLAPGSTMKVRIHRK